MIWHSDVPKTYWGYYQDYLVQMYGQKIQKKFQKNRPKWKRRPIFKFGPKIEWTHPVAYVDANMASSYGLTWTCLKTQGNNLLENKLLLAQLATRFCLWSGIRMGLKLTEVTIRTT